MGNEVIKNEDAYAQCMERFMSLRITSVDGDHWETFCELAQGLMLMVPKEELMEILIGLVPMCYNFNERVIYAQKKSLERKLVLKKNPSTNTSVESDAQVSINRNSFESRNLGYLIEILNRGIFRTKQIMIDSTKAKLALERELAEI